MAFHRLALPHEARLGAIQTGPSGLEPDRLARPLHPARPAQDALTVEVGPFRLMTFSELGAGLCEIT